MLNRIEYVFASGFTADGYYSCLPDLLSRFERIILLQGVPGSGRSSFIKSIGLNLAERGYQVQFWISPLDASYLDGVYIEQVRTAIMIEEVLGSLEISEKPGIEVHRIDLGRYCDHGELKASQAEIEALTRQMEARLREVVDDIKVLRESRLQLAQNYSALLNDEKLMDLSELLIDEILTQGNRESHYLSRAITSNGVVDFFEEITGGCARRYILQGPPGSGKSWLLRRVGEEALARGHKVAFYHSGLDPEVLEMVVLESLGIALADEDIVRIANRPGDCHIDLMDCREDYERARQQPGVRDGERQFSCRMYQAIEGLTRARQVEQRLSRLFTKAMKFDQVDVCREELIREILALD